METSIAGTASFCTSLPHTTRHRLSPNFADVQRFDPSLIRRIVETKTAIHVIDVAADPEYLERRTPSTVAVVELGGVRSFLSVPMLKENELIGSFSLYRQEVRPFTDKQIALVTSFASTGRHRHRERAAAQ